MSVSNNKIFLTSSAVILGCAGVAYLVFKQKYKYLNALDAFTYLNIKIVTSKEECNTVVSEIRRRINTHRSVGFDCEWVTVNGKKRPVALLQISTYDGYCGLFRLNILKSVPQSLKDLLEDSSIYKVGVAPIDDAKYVQQDYCVALKSTIDIRHIAKLSGYEAGGLANLSTQLLRVVLDKSWRVRCSDWEAEELTHRQINYAASDAHVAIRIFVQLINKLGNDGIFNKIFSKQNNNIWSKLDEICWTYVDIGFKNKSSNKQKSNNVSKESKPSKDISASKRYPYATRSKPLYHNCFLEAPDGELLCTCDNKKALWYVEKGLADLVKEDPLTARLRFEPSGRSVGDVGRYYQLTKENKCVVCGAHDSYIRKNVVPREYRKFFPEIMKDHSSHDVVLLCSACHQRSNGRDQRVRDQLAARCDAPFVHQGRDKWTEDEACRKVRSAARALLYQARKHTLPQARRQELEEVILQHYIDRSEVTEELLREAAELQFLFENTDYESHGRKVVEYFLKQEGGLLRLEELWRENFLSTMRPEYMPELWSVTHNEERLRIKFQEGRLSAQDLKLIGLSKWLTVM